MNSGLNLRCDNCGQPAADSDVVCFHCGQPLPGREETSEPAVKAKEGWQQTVSPAAAAVYIGIAGMVLFAFLLVTSNLGSRPFVQVGFATRPPDGWRQVVNNSEAFLFYLPENWETYDGLDPDQAAELNRKVAGNDIYTLVGQPLKSLTDDSKIIYLAENGRPVDDERFAFLAIGSSALLNNMSYVEAIDVWQRDPRLDGEAAFIDDFAKSHAEAVFLFPSEENQSESFGEGLKCRQHFVLGGETSLLLSMCSPAERYLPRASIFEQINSSFQRLER